MKNEQSRQMPAFTYDWGFLATKLETISYNYKL